MGLIYFLFRCLSISNWSQVEGTEEEEEEEKEVSYIPPKDVLFDLTDKIAVFQLNHNEETAALDLMFELERTGDLVKLLDGADVAKIDRVSQYLVASSTYQATKDEREKMLK